MGPLNLCVRDCFNVNFVRFDDETLHQQIESIFRSDFNEPMISSKVAMSVEDQRVLLQMENSVKLVKGYYQLGLPWRHKSVNLPNNREFAMRKLCYLKERFQRDLHLFEKYRDTVNSSLLRLRKKNSLQRTGSCEEYTRLVLTPLSSFSSSKTRESWSRVRLRRRV